MAAASAADRSGSPAALENAAKKDGSLLLGRFEVGELLGAGSFSKVCVARTGELVAIKALDKEKILRDGLVAHISRLEEIANFMRFTVRRIGCGVSLEGKREGEHGPLTIAAEVFELTSSIIVIEVTEKAGDGEEYIEFCNKQMKPGLRHFVFESPPVGKTSSNNN